MEKRILDSRFIQCDCVFSKRSGKLIPILFLIPVDSDDNIIKSDNDYIDHYLYKKTGETFNCTDEIISGIYDLVNKEVFLSKTIIVLDNWCNESLIGKKFAREKYVVSRRFVELRTITKIDFPDKTKVPDNFRYIYFIKEDKMNEFLNKNDKFIYSEISDKRFNSIKKEGLDIIFMVIEPYVECRDENNVRETLNYLTFLK